MDLVPVIEHPAYVTKNADLSRAAQGLVRSAFGLQGQKCSACSVVYVDNSVKSEFIQRAREFAATLAVGDPRKKEIYIGPLYNSGTVDRFNQAVAQAGSEGTVHFGGIHLEGRPENYVIPAIVELPRASNLTRDELFMPFVVVRGVDNLTEGLKEGNSVAYGLSAGMASFSIFSITQRLACFTRTGRAARPPALGRAHNHSAVGRVRVLAAKAASGLGISPSLCVSRVIRS